MAAVGPEEKDGHEKTLTEQVVPFLSVDKEKVR